MAIQPDALAAAYQDFQGPMMVSFEQDAPITELIKSKSKKTKGSGTYMERNLTTKSPMTMKGIFSGDEVLDSTLVQSMEKYRMDPHRVAGRLFIPQKMLDTNTGPHAVIKLLEDYPKLGVIGMKQDREKYFLTGKSAGFVLPTADMLGWPTLNGQFAAGLNVGTENGLLDFAAPASQTDLVQNIAKSLVKRHYNQYADITSWAINGKRQWGKVYRACQQFSGNGDTGGPQLMICDDDTYANFEQGQENLVKLVNVGDRMDQKNALELFYKNARVRTSAHIVLADDFTGVALDGVTYFPDGDWIEAESWQDFKTTPFQVDTSGQDGMVPMASINEVPFFIRKFTAQGCTSGSAT